MNNNDVLRRLRYMFDYNEHKIVAIFALAEEKIAGPQITCWMKKDDHAEFQPCPDVSLASFLNGFINEKRGKKDGPQAKPEQRLNNNIIFRKLKIALNLQADDILEIMSKADFSLSKHELSALFRRPDHKHYRECKDQILRNFLMGLQLKLKPKSPWDEAKI